jgi:site-specific recombinase XerD
MRGVRAFFNFLEREELTSSNPMRKVKMPKLDKTILPAFTPDEIATLERATEGKDPRNVRNRALIFLLLDTGLRVSECVSLRVGDVDPATGLAKVMGKGRKERIVRLGTGTMRAYHRYLRLRGGTQGDPLWLGERGPMTVAGISETLEKLGKSCGVHVHPHKFRRTCALFMLRSGADVFSVQHLLGHSDLTVLRRYLAQTEADVARAHERHSPVDGLRR